MAMDMAMDGKFHIHGNAGTEALLRAETAATRGLDAAFAELLWTPVFIDNAQHDNARKRWLKLFGERRTSQVGIV